MAIRIKNGIYFSYWKDGGKIFSKSLKTRNLTTAQKREESLKSARESARFALECQKTFIRTTAPENIPVVEKLNTTLSKDVGVKLSDMFDIALKYKLLSHTDKKIWNKFLELIQSKCTYASDVTPHVALQFMQEYYGRGKAKPKTHNNIKTILNKIFKLCLIDAKLKESPFVNILNRTLDEVEHYRNFSQQEIDSILNESTGYVYTACLIARWTGLRFSDVAQLQWEDIDFADKSMTVKPNKTARFNRAVYIPLLPPLRDHLLFLFVKDKKGSILESFGYTNYKRFNRAFNTILEKKKIVSTPEGKASFHSWRASFITWLEEQDVSRKIIKGIVGHRSDDILELYSHDKISAQKLQDLFAN